MIRERRPIYFIYYPDENFKVEDTLETRCNRIKVVKTELQNFSTLLVHTKTKSQFPIANLENFKTIK